MLLEAIEIKLVQTSDFFDDFGNSCIKTRRLIIV